MTDNVASAVKTTFEVSLDIPLIKIENVEIEQAGHYRITVTSTQCGTNCHKCGHFIDHFHSQGEFITLRHLPIFNQQVNIYFRPPRYQCMECSDRPTTTQRPTWYEYRSRQTKAFEKHILLACVNSTVSDVSIKECLGYEAVRGIIDRYIAKEVDWATIKKLEVIGLDEIALTKGHKNFATVVTSRICQETVILGVLKDRKKETVKEFLMSIPKPLRKQVRVVCSDMYDGFINAAKEVFGKRIQVVVDRFHVAKL